MIIQFLSVQAVIATEVQQVETNGTIGFAGVYEPIGSPDPTPPESIVKLPISDVAKPEGTLPQTNDRGSLRLLWLGILIISIVILLWKQTNTKLKQ